MPQNASVYIVHDERTRQRAGSLAKILGMHPVAIGALADGLPPRDAIVIDVDLNDLETAGELRRALGNIGAGVPRLFAVEGGARLHAREIQANALGAKRLLRRPLQPEQVRAALAELGIANLPFDDVPTIAPAPAAPPAPPQADAELSVNAGAKLLDSAFSSLSSGEALDVGGALAASRELLSGVGQSGLESWLNTVRSHHDGTFLHCLLVAGAAAGYARQADLSAKDQMTLTVAALLHDIGKAEIPVALLDKPGRLTDDEFEVVKRHPLIARDYLIRQKNLPPDVIAAVTHHHEYLDGTGYPHHLSGYEIEPLTRVLTVCDVYGALVERRAYKPPKTPQMAIMILAEMAGRGKVEYDIVRTLGLAVGVKLPFRQVFLHQE